MSTGCCFPGRAVPPVVCLELTARNRSAACSRGTWAPHRPLWAGCRPPPAPLRSGPSSALAKDGRFVFCFQRWGSGTAIFMIKSGVGIKRDVVGHMTSVDDDGALSQQQLSGFVWMIMTMSNTKPESRRFRRRRRSRRRRRGRAARDPRRALREGNTFTTVIDFGLGGTKRMRYEGAKARAPAQAGAKKWTG